ncbi:hypothetical protein NUZ5A_20105 [Candidatus Nitrosotenuis uzonensis]|uniref:Uncharacterized protein n=1 Tax=Candidatus Nitrosotenuis uzonensis TaxID=1407055 RepID=A0A812F0N3_9ARCH|nr:hypothetical protein NUZ5A_20105 [Candidatus Nitrosotenuis uzonensis]
MVKYPLHRPFFSICTFKGTGMIVKQEGVKHTNSEVKATYPTSRKLTVI